MATPGFGLPEAYMARKLFMEKRKKCAREDEEKSTQMKISTIKGASEGKTASGCFSWVSNPFFLLFDNLIFFLFVHILIE